LGKLAANTLLKELK